jgi:UDP-4-amino-4,6-dideoxy-N-acetyl-beta-L-altrosamine transaminase
MQVIPYGRQLISDEDIHAVVEVLKGDYLTQGPHVSLFEKSICEYTGAKYCIAVCNGTAALHIAVAALQIEEGLEGVTSPITFTASASAMAYCGVKPCFADIDPSTYCLSATSLEKSLTAKTRLAIPVHFAGRVCDMKSISAIAKQRKLSIIEDAAHALGSEYADGDKVGSCKYSDMTIFSFHPVKTITTGEGGAVTTNDPVLYERLKLLRSHGITKDPQLMQKNPGGWYYEMVTLGFNYRLTDIQAALGTSQMKRLDSFKKRRLEIVRQYNAAFKTLSWIKTPCDVDQDRFCYHLYVVQIDWERIGKSRPEVMAQLREKGVLTQVHYIPVHTQPFYKNTYGTCEGQNPVAEAYYQHAMSLPLYQGMTDEDASRVIEAVRELG